MKFNIFDWIIGNPFNKQADAKYQNALKALKAARKKHDRKAERQALADMKTASKAMQKTANKIVAKNEIITNTTKASAMKKGALVIGGLAALVVAIKVIKS